jgi:hypothetical protein
MARRQHAIAVVRVVDLGDEGVRADVLVKVLPGERFLGFRNVRREGLDSQPLPSNSFSVTTRFAAESRAFLASFAAGTFSAAAISPGFISTSSVP